MQNRTKKLTALAMLTSMAFMVASVFRIRGAFAAADFLTYDPKDVVILIGGFMFGPMSAALMSVVLSLIEMVTISNTGPIGALMNAIASASFAVTAALIYSKRRNIEGAIAGLVVGCVVATCTMLLWNYFIIPLYSPFATREIVLGMMLPALLPFNLIKTSLNAAIALLLYKRVSMALKASGLYKDSALDADKGKTSSRFSIAVMIIAAIIAIALIATLLILRASEPDASELNAVASVALRAVECLVN